MTAAQMVEQIEAALASNIGVQSVTTDGTSVTFNRQQLMAELEHWKKRAAKEAGRRPLFRGTDLSGGSV